MNTLKSFISTTAMVVVSAMSLSAAAQAAATPPGDAAIVVAQASTTDMTDGEIRKVDRDTKKITIKHGEIKNLDMPGMTMLFQVKDASMLDMVKPGDRVKFRAEKLGGGIVLTEIEVAK
jgi:Cu(I)/Ag(I) efflux system periplasmic protein CusF